MDYTHRLSISYYKVAAPINEPHKVFLVRHQETGKFYVRKTLDVFSTEVYEQLRSNPVRGIPKIMDFNEEDGKLTLIEEFISGCTLLDLIESTRKAGSPDTGTAAEDVTLYDKLTVSSIGRYMIQLCEILERIHSLDPPLIHRDLKPSNIMITNCDNVILLDFGDPDYVVPYNPLDVKTSGLSPEKAAQMLSQKGFALRGGLQCAALAHRTLGTLQQGVVRFSPSAFSESAQVSALARAIYTIKE